MMAKWTETVIPGLVVEHPIKLFSQCENELYCFFLLFLGYGAFLCKPLS